MPYFGGKMMVGTAIAALLPSHSHYVEPFCGSLGVLFSKNPSRHETVNDLDGNLMNFWRVLREQSNELARVCALTPHSRAEWESCIDLTAGNAVERARRLWVRLSQSRTGRLRRTGWRHYVAPAGSGTNMPGYLAAYVDRMAPAVERLQRVSLECRPALDVLTKYGTCPEVLLYCDPPYLGSTRSNDRAYEHEMMTEGEHRELAEALHSVKAGVVISGYASDLYDRELYVGWDRHTIASATGQGGVWLNRTEVLWSNRPLGGGQLAFDFAEDA